MNDKGVDWYADDLQMKITAEGCAVQRVKLPPHAESALWPCAEMGAVQGMRSEFNSVQTTPERQYPRCTHKESPFFAAGPRRLLAHMHELAPGSGKHHRPNPSCMAYLTGGRPCARSCSTLPHWAPPKTFAIHHVRRRD